MVFPAQVRPPHCGYVQIACRPGTRWAWRTWPHASHHEPLAPPSCATALPLCPAPLPTTSPSPISLGSGLLPPRPPPPTHTYTCSCSTCRGCATTASPPAAGRGCPVSGRVGAPWGMGTQPLQRHVRVGTRKCHTIFLPREHRRPGPGGALRAQPLQRSTRQPWGGALVPCRRLLVADCLGDMPRCVGVVTLEA